jgi:hypothetical protein
MKVLMLEGTVVMGAAVLNVLEPITISCDYIVQDKCGSNMIWLCQNVQFVRECARDRGFQICRLSLLQVPPVDDLQRACGKQHRVQSALATT